MLIYVKQLHARWAGHRDRGLSISKNEGKQAAREKVSSSRSAVASDACAPAHGLRGREKAWAWDYFSASADFR